MNPDWAKLRSKLLTIARGESVLSDAREKLPKGETMELELDGSGELTARSLKIGPDGVKIAVQDPSHAPKAQRLAMDIEDSLGIKYDLTTKNLPKHACDRCGSPMRAATIGHQTASGHRHDLFCGNPGCGRRIVKIKVGNRTAYRDPRTGEPIGLE
jgi:hypothetical protein